jgi:ABC-type antimicrobial peptide transport system permease subunit
MFRNYFKVAVRSLLRNKGFTIINISGLMAGMASAILILLWIQHELSFDRFHDKGGRLYEVYTHDMVDGQLRSGVPTSEMMGPVLQKDYPEIETTARIGWNQQLLLSVGDKNLKAAGAWTDSSFLSMFSFPLVKGNAQTALKDPYALVITEKLAKKLFGEEDPMGKLVKLDNWKNFMVTGVLKDLPNNTQFDFEFLNSSELKRVNGFFDTDWTNVSIRTFVLLKPRASLATANSNIKNTIVKYSGGRAATTASLYPVSQLRLYSKFENGQAVGGRIETVRLFAIIAVFILLIACINFMNLSTAKSEKRAKEVGIRKAVGAQKGSLIGQFLTEAILIAAVAGVLAFALAQFCLPAFNTLTHKELHIAYGNIYYWAAGIGFILFTGLLAGGYPAFFLSGFKPISVLKGTFKGGQQLITPRKALVVLQFTFAIVLIICTIIVQQQIKHAQGRNVGYDKSNLLYVFMDGDIRKNIQLIKTELVSSGAASGASETLSPLTQMWSAGFSLTWKGKNPNNRLTFIRTSTNGGLVKATGLQLVQGRDIDVSVYPTDSTACLINEAALKVMGMKDPIGETIYDEPTTWHIVGVIKDFILGSPYEPVQPMIIKGALSGRNVLQIRLNERRSTAQALAMIEKIFSKYNPAYPFEYRFVDDEYAAKFNDEQLIRTLAGLFAGLTIFISCLGLLGLAVYMAESRTKEIGLRKVLGASVLNITALLSKDFVKLVIIAVLIASPIAWYAMHRWLTGYSYRISIQWWVFVFAGSLAVLIALATVCYHAIKAAVMNPVKSLRAE